jgi:hypothetical protein
MRKISVNVIHRCVVFAVVVVRIVMLVNAVLAPARKKRKMEKASSR